MSCLLALIALITVLATGGSPRLPSWQMSEDLRLDYIARPQFQDFHARKQRWAVIVAHQRAGKTVACVMDLIDSALRNKRQRPPPSYAYVAPLYRQAKQVAGDI